MDEAKFIQVERYSPLKDTLVCQTVGINQRGKIAADMITQWGMVQGFPNGEDSAGRAKIGLMPVSDLIQRACNCAQELFNEFEKRQWIIEIPLPESIKDR